MKSAREVAVVVTLVWSGSEEVRRSRRARNVLWKTSPLRSLGLSRFYSVALASAGEKSMGSIAVRCTGDVCKRGRRRL